MSEAIATLGEADLKALQCGSMRNKDNLKGRCGCYQCLSTFVAEAVTQWCDDGQTALCPVCGIDSVLPSADVPMLEQMHGRWFGRTVRIGSQADWDRAIAERSSLA